MAKLIKTVLIALFAVSTIAAQNQAPLLKGKVDENVRKEISSFVVLYDFEGDTFFDNIPIDTDGMFSYTTDLPGDEVDVMIYIGSSPYGAHLKEGTTTEMNVTDGKAVFSGDNVPESKFFSKYVQAFYPMQYKGSADEPFVFADLKKLLDTQKKEVDNLLGDVKQPLRSTYQKMTDAYYNDTLLLLYGMDQSYNKVNHEKESDEIIAKIDPNGDEARLTGIINHWYNNSDIHKNGDTTSTLNYMIGQFDAIDKTLTNEGNKKKMWETLGSMFMMYKPTEEDVATFFAKVEPQLSRAPRIKERIMEVHESFKEKVLAGESVPTDPKLISPDGKECRLSDLLGKSVVYIDIWATWCKPCVGEIPYMEKVVERFKGNDAITFVSISRDDNRAAWLKKIAKDQPEWQQYVFEKQSGDEFMDAMGINGIPRFLLIGKDGKFINPDAARPSSEDIDQILNSAIESAKNK